jgi:hypothetical protein
MCYCAYDKSLPIRHQIGQLLAIVAIGGFVLAGVIGFALQLKSVIVCDALAIHDHSGTEVVPFNEIETVCIVPYLASRPVYIRLKKKYRFGSTFMFIPSRPFFDDATFDSHLLEILQRK